MSDSRFTIVDLACVLVVAMLGAFLLIGCRSASQELARQGACQANLSAIGKNFAIYGGTSEANPWPVLMSQGDPNAPCNSTTVSDSLWEPWTAGTTQLSTRLGSNAMQNVWVLITSALGGPELFTCPSDPTAGDVRRPTNAGGATGNRYGWTHDSQFSYGMHFPYLKDAAGNKNPAYLGDENLNGALVIMADRNPGGPVGPGRPQSNHGTGVMLLHKGGWVSWYASAADSKAGASYDGTNGDDIYVNEKGVAGGLPVETSTGSSTGSPFQTDTSICPVPSR